MAINKKGRADADAPDDEEVEDDDLADDPTKDTVNTEEAEDDEEGEQEGKGGKKKESDVERLQRELDQAKKAARAEARKRREAEAKLTNAGITEDDDPQAIKNELETLRKERDLLRAQQRKAQVNEAIREVLSSDDKYAPLSRSVKYIAVELDLTDDDLDPDTGKYDEDILDEAAEKAVQVYWKNAPKPDAVRHRATTGGEPARGGNGSKETEKERLAKLEKQFGVNLSY